MSRSANKLLYAAIGATLKINHDLKVLMQYAPREAGDIYRNSTKDPNNVTRGVDLWAESAYRIALIAALGGDITIHGEESLRDPTLDLTEVGGLTALVDVVDGTDLLFLEISLWCSAAIFFIPQQRRILLAIVADPWGRIYFAQEGQPAYSTKPELRNAPVKHVLRARQRIRPFTHTRLADAFIAFYGQKPSTMFPMLDRVRSTFSAAHRLYNFAGNPILAKVAAGSMSAVVEVNGQHAHDVVPGAFIARQAGAYVAARTIDGETITLEDALLKPASEASRLTYVCACTPQLGAELEESIATSSAAYRDRQPERRALDTAAIAPV